MLLFYLSSEKGGLHAMSAVPEPSTYALLAIQAAERVGLQMQHWEGCSNRKTSRIIRNYDTLVFEAHLFQLSRQNVRYDLPAHPPHIRNSRLPRPPGLMSSCWLKLSSFWRFQLASWLAFIIATFPLKLEMVESLPAALFLCLVRDGSSFLLTLGLRSIYRRFWSEQIGTMAALILVACTIGGLLQAGFFLIFHPLLPFRGEIHFTPSMEFNLLYERTGLLFGWSFLYFGIRLHVRGQEREARLARVESEYKATELRLLRAIMDPHFLFNALNFIKSELLGKNDVLARMIQAFTNYLQFALITRNDTFVTVGREYDAMENYLRVEKARFGDEIEIDCKIDPDAKLAMVPGIVIQPLVENAIKHGREQLDNIPLRIGLSVSRMDTELLLEVRNTGEWRPKEYVEGPGGVGLTSLKERLRLLYGERHRFEISTEEKEIVVRVRLPFQLHSYAD